MLINAGITRVVYTGAYPDEFAMSLLHEAKVEIVRLPAAE
jgi:deoxycytidylate deaminase